MDVPEEFGGGGVKDFRYNALLSAEITRVGASGLGFSLQNDVVAPYLINLTSEEQKQRWLPGVVSGAIITAIAMTEPGAGSDLQGLTTTARRDGDEWVLNGSKTFITNGINADLVIVVARTDPEAGARGFSLLVVERGMPGFERGRKLEKLGLKAQDTAELSFSDVRVPAANLVGAEGSGFRQIMERFATERLSLAVQAYATAQRCVDLTIAWARQRETFGAPLASRQVVRHRIAQMARRAVVARTYVRDVLARYEAGDPSGDLVAELAMAKNTAVEACDWVVDQAVQLHGGAGYLHGVEVERHYRDARILGIGGGANEIMDEVVAGRLGLDS
jgi:alkylation response protein AidB-like acyl-CoA dehydrogenase